MRYHVSLCRLTSSSAARKGRRLTLIVNVGHDKLRAQSTCVVVFLMRMSWWLTRRSDLWIQQKTLLRNPVISSFYTVKTCHREKAAFKHSKFNTRWGQMLRAALNELYSYVVRLWLTQTHLRLRAGRNWSPLWRQQQTASWTRWTKHLISIYLIILQVLLSSATDTHPIIYPKNKSSCKRRHELSPHIDTEIITRWYISL